MVCWLIEWISHTERKRTSSQLKRYIVSAHPSRFDEFFGGLQWHGSGHVTVIKIDGGINRLEVVVEADEQGCLELKAAAYSVQPEKD